MPGTTSGPLGYRLQAWSDGLRHLTSTVSDKDPFPASTQAFPCLLFRLTLTWFQVFTGKLILVACYTGWGTHCLGAPTLQVHTADKMELEPRTQ